MSGSRREQILDPVCGMTVNVAAAEAVGRTLEHDGRTYAERIANAEPSTELGICEVAEATEVVTP